MPRYRGPAERPAPSVAGRPVASALVSWSGAVSRALVAAVLVALVGLVFWSVAPLVAGFQGHVVVSGSMQPRLSPGDVVLSREVPVQQLQPGHVLLFPDPDRPDRLLLHRLVSFDAEGGLVTRGDANQSNDSAHVPADTVIGQAQLRIPYVGLPAYWRAQGQWGHIGLTAGLLAAATVFATRGSARESDRAAAAIQADAGTAPLTGADTVPPTAVHPAGARTEAHAVQRARYRNGRRVGQRVGPRGRDALLAVGWR